MASWRRMATHSLTYFASEGRRDTEITKRGSTPLLLGVSVSRDKRHNRLAQYVTSHCLIKWLPLCERCRSICFGFSGTPFCSFSSFWESNVSHIKATQMRILMTEVSYGFVRARNKFWNSGNTSPKYILCWAKQTTLWRASRLLHTELCCSRGCHRHPSKCNEHNLLYLIKKSTSKKKIM